MPFSTHIESDFLRLFPGKHEEEPARVLHGACGMLRTVAKKRQPLRSVFSL